MDDLNKKSSTNIYRTSDENNTKSTTVEEDIKSMTTTSSNDDNDDDARLISNTENQHLINSIALSPHRPVTRHRRSISNIHHAHLPSSLVEQHASSRDSSPSSSTSPISHDLNMTNGQATTTTTTPNTSSTIHSPPPEDDFDIETTLRTTAYKTATNVANTPSYETAQQKETKNIGRPRSNSQDNSSVTSSLDIVRGTITGSQLLSASSNASSSSSSSNNLNQAAGDPNTTNSTLKESQSERTNSLKSEQDAQMSSSALSRVTESSEQSFSYQSQSNYQQHQQQPPLSPLQKHSSLSSIPSSSSLTALGENSTKSKTHQTSMDKNGSMGNNKSMLPNQSNWISADILYQKIRENLKKTSNFAELENSSKSVNKEQIDYRQVLKKKH
ncbi:hypothetical protein C9374_007895 [Naegleria lovaniensis]|uniref:Uncharacterized protein n=1 Tax=Naegleria lovaniensis TaxID=51637 RepID=A0AA88KFY0_NAELO|nr:uncharacterized protein C9374_007895 [Naegleria lovaniensis]KAG2378747.1 hypothetical protein C9374_007895 [Naegleria lovaniensis]